MIQRKVSRLISFLHCRGRVLLLFGILFCLAILLFYYFSTQQVTSPDMLSLPEEFLSPFHTKVSKIGFNLILFCERIFVFFK